MPLVGEAEALRGELIQKAVGEIIFSDKEAGKGADVGTLCTLSPAVKMQRANRVLETMVSWCLVPSPARAAGEFVRTDLAHGARTAPPLPSGLRWEPGGP